MDSKKTNLVLIGMPACGKSTVGVVLAKKLGMRFIDTDLVIQEQTGKLLKELIAEHGDEGFRAIEDRINAGTSTYIPKSALKKALGGIRSGDIIFFNTRVDGLDISHCGIALAEPGKPVTFIHASTVPMKVVVEQKSLEDYVMGKKATTGIEVYRVR